MQGGDPTRCYATEEDGLLRGPRGSGENSGSSCPRDAEKTKNVELNLPERVSSWWESYSMETILRESYSMGNILVNPTPCLVSLVRLPGIPHMVCLNVLW
ncbi:hypothetical protein CBL_05184 [Carabus blaptoides fortunei]